jgi:hypothetical protein
VGLPEPTARFAGQSLSATLATFCGVLCSPLVVFLGSFFFFGSLGAVAFGADKVVADTTEVGTVGAIDAGSGADVDDGVDAGVDTDADAAVDAAVDTEAEAEADANADAAVDDDVGAGAGAGADADAGDVLATAGVALFCLGLVFRLGVGLAVCRGFCRVIFVDVPCVKKSV